MIDVIIPALNTADTIVPVLNVWLNHPAVGQVWVCVDWATSDETLSVVRNDRTLILHGPEMLGKGQCVQEALDLVRSDWVTFCDSDIRGLSADHASLILADAIAGNQTMTIGVPDQPANYPRERSWAWPWVSGQRCLPTSVVRPLRLHGYLMETQINQACKHARVKVRLERLPGLKSDYLMTPHRVLRMEQDKEWAIAHGVLSE